MIGVRARLPALQAGRRRSIDAAPELFCFVRELNSERYAIALNFSSHRVPLGIREPLATGGARLELSTDPDRDEGQLELETLVLGPDEGLIARLD